jgi:DNA-binding transcriptional MerR regulator
MSELVKISEVALKYGITTRTLRFYEDAGLIKSFRTEDYAYRLYDQKAIKRIEQILVLRKLNIAIKDIKKIYESNSIDVLLDVLGKKVHEIDDEVALLRQLREIVTTFIRQLEKCDFKIDTDLNLLYEKASAAEEQVNDSKDICDDNSMGKLMEVAEKLERMPDIRIIMLPRLVSVK